MGVSTSPTLEVTVTDPDSNPMDVTFFGREAGASAGADFTIIALPDTQNYSTSYPDIFTSQTQWIADNMAAENIVFVTHLGDVVNSSGSTTEYGRADTSMDILDDGNVPYSMGPGNHDYPTTNFNTYFGVSRFSGKSYYAGNYNGTNNSNYSLFSASGMDFILINLEYQPGTAVLDWADDLLKDNSTRRAIVVSHSILNTDGSWTYQPIHTAVSDNPNLFLMLAGHMHGEARRTDVAAGTVYTLLSDYQDYPNGGNGYLRIMEFSPANDEIRVKTYSPYQDQYETDASSEFVLSYGMDGTGVFADLGTDTGVASGQNARPSSKHRVRMVCRGF
jgi:hypothetical protein